MSSSPVRSLLDEVATDPAATCPACGAQGLAIVHEHRGIPVHSCRLMDTREQAETFTRGDLRLGFCAVCGFITNTTYEPEKQSYFVSYEETQGFSPRFRAFMKELAQRWIDGHALAGKDVLEIGCGKAEFLLLMCELGVGHGVGIDPAIVLERIESPAADRVELIRDLYSEKYGHLSGDAVICRHTLEHIHPVADFMRIIRRSLEGRPGTAVLFELPDVRRVLDECAFWDIYYEHCTYFTPGSLARLFRATGFDVTALELDYDDQYILIEAVPGSGQGEPLPLEESPDEVAEAVAGFRRRFESVEERWRAEIGEVRARGGRVVVWGSGSKGVSFLTTLGIQDEIEFVVDINPHKHGKFMPGTGHEIVAPRFLSEYRPELVIAMNPIYLEEIQADLDAMGVSARLLAV
ncbi:Methyltransferase domain [Gaiella occulta]|uniref:Methyltransferase domain n=1 Tax=Gaiella occulta TaxID=1002870 RepID=A0A7M2YXR3_9ACTN|nr:class I SAM-dependent methyltransferase [Gaiella occulta]RDI74846.1 Methyltransferase domain [Gaiella occulta]